MAIDPPPRPRNTDPQAHRELIALKAWRDQAVRDRRVVHGSIKDTDLTRIVTHGRRDVRQIRIILSEANRHLAQEILDVQLAAVSPGSGGPATRPAGPPTASAEPARRPVEVPRTDPEDAGLEFAPTKNVHRSVTKPVKISETGDQLRLRWPVPTDLDEVVVYRLVSLDDRPPASPDGGTLIAVGTEPTALDHRAPTRAVRYYTVFANSGYTEQEAYEAQPRLVASGTHFFSVPDLDCRPAEGQLMGRWTRLPGTVRVRVYRIPIEEAADVVVPDAQHEVDPGQLHLDGILDLTATSGATYRYDFQPEVEVVERGERRIVPAPPVSREITIPAPLTAVADLTAVPQLRREGLVTYDLAWTRPNAGRVEVYCTPSDADPGARDSQHDYGALGTSLGLDAAHRADGYQEDLGGGRVTMRAVRPVDATWRRIHFTPVTVLDGQILVGKTIVEVVIDPPGQPEVIERCDYQALKFAWPQGAAKLVTRLRPTGAPAEPITTVQPWFDEIDKAAWTDLGSLQFRERLPPEGCRIDLAGIAYDDARAEFGPTVSVDYPGLTQLQYQVLPQQRRRFSGKETVALIVRLRADRVLSPAPTFALVHQQHRLPLHPGDGQPLLIAPNTEQVNRPQPTFTPERLDHDFSTVGWRADVPGLTGYVRLFALTDLDVALLDPVPETLVVR